ncbi:MULTISPECIES: sulfate reduction electron transfer complex DsrMKJOP subunit DsrJ [unclassified Pseudodesulfovibrio]|uniref:sulfate reduction electron transfer complex DsrMKJOP subunit DsrJ n=1 Tax=unclassified Pseudodesulfovibrio TaxID=2661612 RepID=UPI000FEBD719|nr:MULTISPECIES: sulfate reduction electron transfer complex DsrMKJOP subunit DsrJ [unclassified Pseudodesulfovibrio]MCJ2166173.1 sulfate reduction electron transfer complex DsrMKJOP subunit DsrJ [Pseudodesulfovibrio sp. S3-i]RWU02360.1 cytochrome C [Pseudodesulfovibrio sp. S3]
MKMQNGFAIIAGLIIFIGMITAPFAVGTMTKEYKQPELKMPVGEKECIESKEFMRTEHMQLLNDWRDWALRDGKRVYTNHAGKEFVISLQNTCMKCHNNKADFCDKCHTDAGVSPYCWDCHIQPEGLK